MRQGRLIYGSKEEKAMNFHGLIMWVKGINKGNLDEVLKLKTNVRTRSNAHKLYKFMFRKEKYELIHE